MRLIVASALLLSAPVSAQLTGAFPKPTPKPTPAFQQEWLVQAMWLGIDQVPYDGDKSPPREIYPDAASAKRAAVKWCATLAGYKGVPAPAITEAFRAPAGETHMPYQVCRIDNLTYVSVNGIKK